MEDDQGQGVVPYWKREKISWCGCKGEKEQSSVQARDSRSAARERSSRKEVRRTFKMLREVWLNIGVEKIDTHEGIMIKALLDSGTMGMFMDRQMAARHGFKLQKLKKPIAVRNVDGTNNSGGAITHQVECNIFFKGHVERMQMDICDLGKTEVILGMLWLAAHNCHDLAKWLSYYLYFFSFLFFFFSFILDLLHRRKCGKASRHECHTTTVT